MKIHVISPPISTGEDKALGNTDPLLPALPKTSYTCLFTSADRCSSYKIETGRTNSSSHGSTSQLPSQPYINASKSQETS